MEEEPHKVFRIPETLEAILLSLDITTLLTSAQRVCRQWRLLILDSENLQIALFLRPSKEQVVRGVTQRQQNPLIKTNLWPGYFRKRLHTYEREVNYAKLNLPLIDPQREAAYLRPGASWRRMLVSQPPTSHLALVELRPMEEPSPLLSKPRLRCKEGNVEDGYLTLGRLEGPVNAGDFMPGQDPMVFWCDAFSLKRREHMFREERAKAGAEWLMDCDAVIFAREFWVLNGRGRGSTFLKQDRWLTSNGGIVVGDGVDDYRRALWND